MKKSRKYWIIVITFFIIGAYIIVDRHTSFLGIIARFVSGSLFALFSIACLEKFFKSTIAQNLGVLKGEKKFLSIILMLAAKLANGDGKVDSSERKLIAERLSKEFKTDAIEKYLDEFESYLEADISIQEIGKIIASNFDDFAKSQLMYLLISLTTIDGVLSNSELNIIKDIAKYGRIKSSTYKHVFKTFEFKREQTYQRKSKQQSSRKASIPNQSALKVAYRLLGITENASLDAIKKAYRKLAKKHHPDKVAHLGENYQNSAKEKFQLIADAYELIKTKRNIK